MLQVLVTISPTIVMQREACGYTKVIHKKRVEKNWTSVQLSKQWVLRCPPEKKRDE